MKIYEQFYKDIQNMTEDEFVGKHACAVNCAICDGLKNAPNCACGDRSCQRAFYRYMHSEIPKEYNLTFMETLDDEDGTQFEGGKTKLIYLWDCGSLYYKSKLDTIFKVCHTDVNTLNQKYRVADDD